MDKLVALELVERLKNNNFILESKMAELNQKKKKSKKNSKQPDWLDAVSNLYFTLEISE